MNKRKLTLENLDCANCAAKIENEVKKIEGLQNVTVDFVTKKLVYEIDTDENITDKITEVIKNIEPDVKVITDENKIEENDSKKEIILLTIGAIFFAIGMLLKTSTWVELVIFLISYVIVGGEIVLKALKNIVKGKVFDENFLMAIATIGAFFTGSFAEGVAVMLFYKLGELFQDIAVNRSRKSISSLMDIRPDYANLKFEGDIKKVSPEQVNIGDIIIIKPGEKVPLDGKIIDGSSTLDTSALTGESMPREVKEGSEILSGCINKSGVLTVEVTKEFGESTVSKILDLVENASSKKAEAENFITKFAKYYTPIVVIIAVIIALIPPLIINGATFTDWIYRSLVFLVISCPCALVVSIPLGFFGGIGGASKKGILIKGSNYLEALNNINTVIFDKTGTLTKGVFDVTEIRPENDISREELIEYAAYAESYSNHPIAQSILNVYGKQIENSKVESYDEISGYGIKIKKDNKEILVGNSKLMDKENIKYNQNNSIGTLVYIAVDRVYIGYIAIADEIKDDATNLSQNLKSLGVKKTVILTGDSKVIAEKVAENLEIDDVYYELLPNQKVEILEDLSSKKQGKGNLIFVGDGINDAPVLARADIGIAMGGLGSDAAIEAADIVIMTDEPSKIVTAIKIAKRTRKIVMQNICFAIGVKVIFLTLGALGFASMWEAVFADVGVTIISIANAARAMRVKKL